MTSTQATLKCFIIILNSLSKKSLSFKALSQALSDGGFSYTERTIQRLIEKLRYEFDVDIAYSNVSKKYHLSVNAETPYRSLIQISQLADFKDFSKEILSNSFKIWKLLDIESNYFSENKESMIQLLKACFNNYVISFEHKNFIKGSTTAYTIMPYLLKEYLQRWYLVGIDITTKEVRNFGIERLTNLTISKQKFIPDLNFSPKKLYENTVGLNYTISEPQKIIIAVTPLLANYLTTQPWHRSQKVLKTGSSEWIAFSFYLNINQELIQKILQLGNQVKVLEPLVLKNEIKTILQSSLIHYL